jgi:hypothetical protein
LSTTHPINETLRSLYLSGTHGEGRYVKHKLGQPRVVLAVTGGGGQFFGEMLKQPGASSCILETVVPYSKNSCLDFLEKRGQTAEGIGFCSEGMAWRLATSARDRAMELENDLNRWPDVHGVSSTATIVSHYPRRGGYRCHAAAVDARGCGSTYTHTMVKGHRGREGEDLACALLTARALADSTGRAFDATHGVRLVEEPAADARRTNAVGEEAEGIEAVPARETHLTDPATGSGDYVLVRGSQLCMPRRVLPKGSVVVWCGAGGAAAGRAHAGVAGGAQDTGG